MLQYFELLNKYYDKIYVLSIESAVTRRELFTEQFKGLNYSFFFGAVKNKFSLEEKKEKGIYNEKLTRHHHRYSKIMNPGEVACSLSHKMIYEDMLANNYNRILIFEDDAVPNLPMVKQIQAILLDIPDDCELLFWGWNKNQASNLFTYFKQIFYHVLHSIGMLKWDHQMINNLFARPFSQYLKKAGFHDQTFAYAINANTARKLLKMQTPIQYIADNLLAHAATKEILKAYITRQQVFLEHKLSDGTPKDSYIRLVK